MYIFVQIQNITHLINYHDYVQCYCSFMIRKQRIMLLGTWQTLFKNLYTILHKTNNQFSHPTTHNWVWFSNCQKLASMHVEFWSNFIINITNKWDNCNLIKMFVNVKMTGSRIGNNIFSFSVQNVRWNAPDEILNEKTKQKFAEKCKIS